FLLAIAIYDDLAAIIIIALFYSAGLNIIALALGILGVILLFLLNKFKIENIIPYILTGFYMWVCFHYSGIHTTIAGVLLGAFIPISSFKNPHKSPLKHLMHIIHPWVAFFILPLFAFVSSGVSFKGISSDEIFAPLTIGIALSLFFGKQIGIFFTTYLCSKLKIADKPEGTNWLDIYGTAVIAGIGFTMSLFVGLLAFKDPILQDEVKIGVIAGSLLSTILGFFVFRVLKKY
ncbi:MAG: Na+/H+ antiporter NhaA, partial [Rickettsiales bacterium]|nr:Na+/H+ antiporter NhaA [Rickettsiales bacterium]